MLTFIYAECLVFIVKLGAFVLHVIMVKGAKLSAVAPNRWHNKPTHFTCFIGGFHMHAPPMLKLNSLKNMD